MRDIIIKWLTETKKLRPGQEIFIPVEDKDSQRSLQKLFRYELQKMFAIDPIGAATVLVQRSYRDNRFWVILKKVAANPLLGFMKDRTTGVTTRVNLSVPINNDRLRIIELMKQDGLTLEQAQENLPDLTEEEW